MVFSLPFFSASLPSVCHMIHSLTSNSLSLEVTLSIIRDLTNQPGLQYAFMMYTHVALRNLLLMSGQAFYQDSIVKFGFRRLSQLCHGFEGYVRFRTFERHLCTVTIATCPGVRDEELKTAAHPKVACSFFCCPARARICWHHATVIQSSFCKLLCKLKILLAIYRSIDRQYR